MKLIEVEPAIRLFIGINLLKGLEENLVVTERPNP